MTAIEKKKALVDYLIALQADIESHFDDTVSDNWSLNGFLEDIDNSIAEINDEIEAMDNA